MLTMPKLDGLQFVLDYLAGLQPKIAAQIAKKAMSLAITPMPPDSRPLEGYTGYLRVDSGEHRIVYRFHQNDVVVEVVLVGKRNDADVYRRLRRLRG
jgi:mRNA interferase RelE/StbE